MMLVSGYDNELYRSIHTPERGWKRIEIDTYTRDTTGKNYARTEVLWKDKYFLKAEKSGKVPIRLTSKEKNRTS